MAGSFHGGIAQRSALASSIVNQKSKIVNGVGGQALRRDCGSAPRRIFDFRLVRAPLRDPSAEHAHRVCGEQRFSGR